MVSRGMKLHGTPLSHFTRKIRILMAELGLPFDFVRERSVMATTPDAYAGNPLQRVPILIDGDVTLVDSDHIARYLVTRFDPADRLGVLTIEPDALNELAVIHGVMANEVVIILARRGGVTDVEHVVYFRKLIGAMQSGLAWLETRPAPTGELTYREIALACMWQHVEHYDIVPLGAYPRVRQRVERIASRPSIAATTPAQSLADAAAAGWTPA